MTPIVEVNVGPGSSQAHELYHRDLLCSVSGIFYHIGPLVDQGNPYSSLCIAIGVISESRQAFVFEFKFKLPRRLDSFWLQEKPESREKNNRMPQRRGYQRQQGQLLSWSPSHQ